MLSGPARPRWAAFVASAALVGLALSACASASPTPAPAGTAAPTQPVASSAPTATPAPATVAPTNAPTTAADGGIAGAEKKLAAIASYRFKVTIAGKGALGSFGQDSGQVQMSGTVIVKPTNALHFEMSGLDMGSGSPSKMGLTIIGDKGWIDLGTGMTMEVPADSAQGMGQSFDAFRPEKLFGSTFDSYGSGFKAGSEEQKNGVATIHYTADETTLKGFATAYGEGTWSADVWIAKDGGYPVSSSVVGKVATGENAGEFRITMDITNVDDPANKVTAPA